MAATMHQVIARFMEEAGRDEPHFLTRSDGSLFVNSAGTLYYDRSGRGSWVRGRPASNIPMAIFIGDRFKGGFMLLNGDGMEDPQAMDWQTTIREHAQRVFTWQKCAILPFSALNAAELDLYSIRTIEVTQDRQEEVVTYLDGFVKAFEAFLKDPATWAAKHKFQVSDAHPALTEIVQRNHVNTITRLEGNIGIRKVRFEVARMDTYKDDTPKYLQIVNPAIYAQPENGRPGWHAISFDHTKQEWYWRQLVHRLGAVVFSARDIHGDKARWLSAFDTHEPEPLYFLAQLPPKGKISNYGDAITSLAPPMVQTAIEKNIPVFRQGDVFAVETNWTDEQVYAVAKTRVRRAIAIQNAETMYNNHVPLSTPGENEVKELIPCLHCKGGKVEVGCGPKAKAALMILHTGHTASEVVFTEDGRTFIRGSMHHDPHLETPGRVPDHREVPLSPEKWFLCIRNTVPRMKDRRTTVRNQDIKYDMPAPNSRDQAFFMDSRLRSRVHPPKGYEFVEHRLVRAGDIWLSNSGQVRSHGTPGQSGGRKRWILRPVENIPTEAEAQAAA